MKLIYTSTKSKIKTKKKPGWQKTEADYKEWLKKHGVDTGKKKLKLTPVIINPVVVSGVMRRETAYHPSLNTHSGSTAPAEKKVYTGDKMLGIAVMHKSNLVPIFTEENAVEVSKMRRG
jgi:hypothetical protein